MIRGEVYWTNFPPGVGGEIRNSRPGVIVTSDLALPSLNRVQVVPLTRSTGRLFLGEALVTFQGSRSKALATRIGTVDRSRLGRRIGGLTSMDMALIDEAIREQLGLG